MWQFFKRLNIELLRDLKIPLLGIYPKALKTGTQTSIRNCLFIAALFTTAGNS